MAGTNVVFNGFSLQSANILSNTIDHASMPNKNVSLYGLSHANRSSIPFVEYPSRKITVSGTVVGTNINDMDNQLDTLRGSLLGIDKNLDIDYAGSTRRYLATVNSCDIDRPGGLGYANFSIEFICTLPFGIDISQTTVMNLTGRTAGSYSDSYTYAGNAPYQKPIFTMTYTAISATGSQSVNIGNNGTGQLITVTRTWAVNDVLQIDTFNKIVTVNATPVDFTGAFPEFAPGLQSMSYSDGFTSRTFNYNVVYTRMFL